MGVEDIDIYFDIVGLPSIN